jgi:L-alanine-DL-glutamate epimerase-like enolase superfamily enzyme
MELHAQPLNLTLASPFRISRGVQTVAANLLVRVQADDATGFGEAAPRPYFGETQDTALAAVAHYAGQLGDDPFAIDWVMARLERSLSGNASVRAAIDMALYDLVGTRLGVPVYRLLGLSPAHLPHTSLTIAIDTPAEMARRAVLARDFPILKVKLGTRHDLASIREIRDVSNATIRVDANAAWTTKQALQIIEQLAPLHIEMVEQPIPSHDLDDLRFVRERSPIPIFADESCIALDDVPRLAGVVDGINIKLAKCGGINQAVKMIYTARAHGLKVMLGCMIESSLGITATAHLAPLADLLDIDGALLLAEDPFVGAQIVEGQVMLPDAPGLGVRPRAGQRRIAGRKRAALPASAQSAHESDDGEGDA